MNLGNKYWNPRDQKDIHNSNLSAFCHSKMTLTQVAHLPDEWHLPCTHKGAPNRQGVRRYITQGQNHKPGVVASEWPLLLSIRHTAEAQLPSQKELPT